MEGSVCVIGGGIAGIQTSLDLTELGFKVYLVEKTPSMRSPPTIVTSGFLLWAASKKNFNNSKSP